MYTLLVGEIFLAMNWILVPAGGFTAAIHTYLGTIVPTDSDSTTYMHRYWTTYPTLSASAL